MPITGEIPRRPPRSKIDEIQTLRRRPDPVHEEGKAAGTMSRVELRGVRKVYPTGVVAVDGIDLRVDDGEVVVLLGPTGCGKTSVLRLIAGLESPTDGEVRIGGDDVDSV